MQKHSGRGHCRCAGADDDGGCDDGDGNGEDDDDNGDDNCDDDLKSITFEDPAACADDEGCGGGDDFDYDEYDNNNDDDGNDAESDCKSIGTEGTDALSPGSPGVKSSPRHQQSTVNTSKVM